MVIGGIIPPAVVPLTPLSTLTPPSTYAKRVSDAATAALFHFDEGTGSTATDASGTYTAALTSTSWLGADGGNRGSASPRLSFGSGSALVFNGTSSVASVTGLLDTIPATGSIECWFRPAVALPITGQSPRLFSKETIDLGGGDSRRIDVHFDGTTGKLTVLLKAAGGNYFLRSLATTWAADVDHHFALTWGVNGALLYIDGVLNEWLVDYEMPANGSYRPLDIGAIFYGGVFETGSFFNGSVDEFRVKNSQMIPEELHASFQRWPYTLGIEENGRWIERTTVLSPTGTGTFDSDLVIEPSTPYFDGTVWHMFYTGYRLSSFTGRIAHLTSPDGTTWTRQGVVIGSGSGGESAPWVSGFEVVNLGGGNLVGFYSAGFGNWNRTVSSDWGATWSKTGVVIATGAQPSWMVEGVSNSGILVDGATWRLLFESGDSSAGKYYLGAATSTDMGMTWTLYAGNPLASLAVAPGGTYSGPSILKSGSIYHVWYHAAVKDPSPPNGTALAHSTSTDFINWTPVYDAYILTVAGETFSGGRADQLADPTKPTLFGSDWFMFYDVDRNVGVSGVQGRIDRVRFNSTP